MVTMSASFSENSRLVVVTHASNDDKLAQVRPLCESDHVLPCVSNLTEQKSPENIYLIGEPSTWGYN
jgi:hypothetical protein